MQQVTKIKGMDAKKIRVIGDEVSIKEAMVGIAPGETVAFSASRYSAVRSLASAYGFEMGCKFTTKADRVNNRVLVTRVN